MSRLPFTLRREPEERLDLSSLTPKGLAGMDRKAIAAIPIGQSKRGATVGDLFRIAGKNVSDILFEGGSERLDGVGTGLDGGTILVVGDVGAQAGRAMGSGRLVVEGHSGPHAGSAMRGGRIEILGNAGDHLGGPLAGELAGMNGGLIIVRGRAGHYGGDRMRRGSIVLDRAPGNLSPGFVACGAPDLAFAGLLDRHLIAEGVIKRPLLGRAPGRFAGDNAVLGLGEILFPAR